MSSSTLLICNKRRYALLLSIATPIIFIVALCFAFEPRWETNDDVGMSMIAHGYGIATYGSPKILFSNVVWGYFIRTLPEINGVVGYSIISLFALAVVGAVIVIGLINSGVHALGAISCMILILARPVLFPQFTINAGLIMVAAVVCWHVWAKEQENSVLAVGCVLAWCSYLIRSYEFLLVLCVSLPLLPWREFFSSRRAKVGGALLFLAIAAAGVIDRQAYQGEEWRKFNELNSPRAAFTDYSASIRLRERPDIRERHGYSQNDIDLISSWFFVDRNIANPSKLQAMLDELGGMPVGSKSLENAWLGIRAIFSPALLPSIIAALLLLILRTSWPLTGCWVLFIGSMAVIGYMGRPGVLRIYQPLAALLLIAPFLWKSRERSFAEFRKWFQVGLFAVGATVSVYLVSAESKEDQTKSASDADKFINLPQGPFVVWGDAFPYQVLYPVLKVNQKVKSLKHYGLGTSTWAPFTVAYSEALAGRDLITLLLSDSGADILQVGQLERLKLYCLEHHGGSLVYRLKDQAVVLPESFGNYTCHSTTFK